ncbi:BNR repeat domain protein [Cystobacter fuscus DSM 2262]|uniref:BNR repeat domain protein n=1 Tax=Cystobacter fuscus (strain ATCC 25194 / DSM 2262 / NBRC 100088 / M29) TaxID=1242864 RepID=S9R629_CYSF2|nr:BNR repeat domain protein [Cystobacter fuscus DSM 2262]
MPQPLVATCGNKSLEEGETCDDGNLVNGDGCSFVCRLETPRAAAGEAYTLIQRDDGSVWTWGANSGGQLGDGTTAYRLASAPVDFSNGMVVKRVAAGGSHALAVLSDKTLWAWGRNGDGQLGVGSTTSSFSPVKVPGRTGVEVVAMAASTFNSAAVLSDGKVLTWGYNAYGQLGNGSTTDQSSPVEVSALSDIKGVSVGKYHMLALRSGGTVWAWGFNGSGQLGLGSGSNTQYNTPQQAAVLKGVASVSAGDSHSLALRWDGTVWAWGQNNQGQLGIGSFTDRPSPVQVPRLTGVVEVAAGQFHALALRLDGTVWAWGFNGSGQLGDGTTLSRSSPVQVPGLTGVVSVAAGDGHSVAVLSDGRVYTWGRNSAGQLGDGSQDALPHPTPGQALLPFVCGNHRLEPEEQCDDGNSINGDGCSALCLAESGSSLCGDGIKAAAEACDDGNLVNGDGCSFVCRLETPRLVAGAKFTLFQKNDGKLWAWGHNFSGQLGDDSTVNRLTPVSVSTASLTDVKNVAAGGFHSLALGSDGKLWSWGSNSLSQLGVSRDTLGSRASPALVSGVSGVVAVAAGETHSLVVLSNGKVSAWGYNGYGQIGDGCSPVPTFYCSSPTEPTNLFSILGVAAGQNHSLALRSDGTVWAWGRNNSGQLGDGSLVDRTRPVQVARLNRVVSVVAGLYHSLALRSDGTVWAWGDNGSGQLGDGTYFGQMLPVQVPGLSGVVAVAAGGRHSLALRADGTVWAWGYNSNGQIGDGSDASIIYRPSPVKVLFSSQDVVMGVAAGDTHSVAVLSGGRVRTWGQNDSGQLGYATNNTDRSTPGEVTLP